MYHNQFESEQISLSEKRISQTNQSSVLSPSEFEVWSRDKELFSLGLFIQNRSINILSTMFMRLLAPTIYRAG